MKRYLFPIIAAATALSGSAALVSHFPMDVRQGQIQDKISGSRFAVQGLFAPENVAGAEGKALRLDGYTSYVDASIGAVLPAGNKQMTFSMWTAVETYPIIRIDENTTEKMQIAGCYDETARSGFGFFIGFDGKWSFKVFVGGWPVEVAVDTPLPRYQWNCLTAVVDRSARKVTVYNNGVAVGSTRCNGDITYDGGRFRIGRGTVDNYSGPFVLTSFNGLVDDIRIWDEAVAESTIASWKPENEADLSVAESRFAGDPLRPAFHGMPGANWTNETHGMTYSNGRFHVFFQKNANGPYMSRLHWGHISSENLYDWQEEKIAIAPGASFDMKGCWSGCVFSDDELTGGKPSIIYTGVDYAKAVIVQASPLDADLIEWEKGAQPIINGRPSGLSDDFRDPYFFRSGNGAYIIVGSSKDGMGTATLHSYDPATRSWSNDGSTFFTGTNKATCGTFWEMPNMTKIGDKWLFTVTPMNTSKGVAAIYWTGSVNADGTFRPDRTAPSNIELPGMARDGYGLLSPTIYQHEGKTIALGIVPDKLSSQDNYDMGYAHTYSLPREWSIDGEGNLCQKPYSGLAAMRCDNGFAKSDFALDGSLALDGIEGRAVELSGEFTVTAGKCGFTLLDDGATALKVYYDGASNEIVVDARSLDRRVNDSGVFDGFYHSVLPRQLAKGETVKLNLFYDHSVVDLFVNDTWASSVRVFPREKGTENATVFAEGGANQVKSVNGWMLDANRSGAGVGSITVDGEDVAISAHGGVINYAGAELPAAMSVFNLAGSKVFEQQLTSESGSVDTGLSGFHIVTIGGAVKKVVL